MVRIIERSEPPRTATNTRIGISLTYSKLAAEDLFCFAGGLRVSINRADVGPFP